MMMRFMQSVLRKLLRSLKDSRGVSLYEVTAAVGMTAIIASVAIPVALDRIEDAKKAKGQLEVETISKAMLRFFQDTGKWPGELEIKRGGKFFLKTGTAPLPPGLSTQTVAIPSSGIVDCPAAGNVTFSDATALDVIDFLVRKPSGYPNWRGPYMDQIEADPFEKAYIIHILPLFCGETVDIGSAGGGGGGNLGYGWILSAGPDQSLQQDVKKAKLDSTHDDAGRNMGKRTIISGG